jgi:hypothetical protein
VAGARTGGPAPGLAFATCDWIFEKEIATICGATCGMEVRPNETGELGQPLRWVTFPAIGATNGEMFFGNELAADCAADRVNEFFAAPPFDITGSPVTPLAMKSAPAVGGRARRDSRVAAPSPGVFY